MEGEQVPENMDSLDENVSTFLNVGCGCSGGQKGNQCSKSFSKETMLFNLHNCLELSRENLIL